MKRPTVCRAVPVILSYVIVAVAYAGGWAVITVKDVPDYAVAGKPVTLTFSVRQHGITLLDDLQPGVRATTAGGPGTRAAVASTGVNGEYTASLVLPEAGEWTIRIDSGFNTSATTLPVLKVIASGSPSPLPFSPVIRGERLFAAKGCMVCHRANAERVGLDLTARRFSPDDLKRFLADPDQILKRRSRPEGGRMPNLNLNEEEIAALVAFIDHGAMRRF
jgi:mono/diheme cytochrome c family protein